ncbi:C-type lectin domain family 4 member D-like [Argopecten irradians]|uniref:C-type lectin domain family 4 member D-like n=1 Tax=Argopecten irradians TaxID=31199 RepID=UPI00371A8998
MNFNVLYALCMTFAVVVVVKSRNCEQGWAQFKEDCIFFGHDRTTWDDAEKRCRDRGAWLLSDDNEEKHDFLSDMMNVLFNWHYERFFIGGSDYYFEGQFRWVETGMNVGPFSRWATGQPQMNNTRNCLMLTWENDQLVWSDQNCRPREYTYYICEKLANSTSPGVIG